MKLLSEKFIDLKVLMVFDYVKMEIIETGKITNLYQYVNNNLRTIYIVYWCGWLPIVQVNILSKRKALEASQESVAGVCAFSMYVQTKRTLEWSST